MNMPTAHVRPMDYEDSPVKKLVSTGHYPNASWVLNESLGFNQRDDCTKIDALPEAAQARIAEVKARRVRAFDSPAEIARHCPPNEGSLSHDYMELDDFLLGTRTQELRTALQR